MPLKSATICGIAVMRTRRADTAPIAVPTRIGGMISGQLLVLWMSAAVIPSTSNIPTAATRLPCRAVAGERSSWMPNMKLIAVSNRNSEDVREHGIQLGQHLEPEVLDQLGLERVEPGHHRRERHDAIALPDAEDRRVDMGRPGFECGERVCHRAPGVVMRVKHDVNADDAADNMY